VQHQPLPLPLLPLLLLLLWMLAALCWQLPQLQVLQQGPLLLQPSQAAAPVLLLLRLLQ
jgi:hypothetical protein